MKMIIKYFYIALLVITTLVVIYIIFIFITSAMYYFKPAKQEICNNMTAQTKSIDTLFTDLEYKLMTWNIGYAGLGMKSDFFYDGGNMTRPDPKYFNECFTGIKKCLQNNNDCDFIFLQEVDSTSKRSYYTDEIKAIEKLFINRNIYFAKNYSVKYVPVPIFKPMGKVESGIMTISSYTPKQVYREDLETKFPFPEDLFILKRCVMILKFNVSNNKELILINIHNSAFDKQGIIRANEAKIISSIALTEYKKGNYILIGGDWNMNPSSYNAFDINNGDNAIFDMPIADNLYIKSGWQINYDKTIPTNRSVVNPYIFGETKTTIYDFIITSPNIETITINTINYRFEFSDHNPVIIKFKLKKQ